jgi:hypothetical protein
MSNNNKLKGAGRSQSERLKKVCNPVFKGINGIKAVENGNKEPKLSEEVRLIKLKIIVWVYELRIL